MPSSRRKSSWILIAGLALAPLAAEAQSYRCVGKDGKKYYGQTVPSQCVGLPMELLNAQGLVIQKIDPHATMSEQQQKAAEAEEKRKRDVVIKEEIRKNKALLSTYTSADDVERARKQALTDNQKAVAETEKRIGDLKKRQGELKKELEFFQGKNKPPAKLLQEVKDNEFTIEAQENLLVQKKRDVDTINAKYDDDKKRYIELTKGPGK